MVMELYIVVINLSFHGELAAKHLQSYSIVQNSFGQRYTSYTTGVERAERAGLGHN